MLFRLKVEGPVIIKGGLPLIGCALGNMPEAAGVGRDWYEYL
jgi:hypothetical protein